jgi:enoyl-CoA hydratase/carnithine racemase
VSDLVLVDEPAPRVRRLTLNRPDSLNTATAELVEALHVELRRVAADRSCRAVVLTGAGRAFCAGLDLHGYGESPGSDPGDVARLRFDNQVHMSRLVLALRATPQPVIAAVNGPAAGLGIALVLGCDIRFAAREAVFRVAFMNIGVSNCDMSTSWLLPRLVGAARAHELMLTARRFDAEEALRIGLLADVVEGEQLIDRALEACAHITALAPWAVRLTKQGMSSALEIPSQLNAVEYEDRQQIMSTFGTAPPEAVTAFLEKRPAEFSD